MHRFRTGWSVLTSLVDVIRYNRIIQYFSENSTFVVYVVGIFFNINVEFFCTVHRFSFGPIVWLLSNRCLAKFDLQYPVLKSPKYSLYL